MKDILSTPYMRKAREIIEGRLGPPSYVRGLSQLSPGTQPMLTNLSSEVPSGVYTVLSTVYCTFNLLHTLYTLYCILYTYSV